MIKNRFEYQSNRSMIEINTMHAYFFIASKLEFSYFYAFQFNFIIWEILSKFSRLLNIKHCKSCLSTLLRILDFGLCWNDSNFSS